MAMDPCEGYQTHFDFDHFDLEPVVFSRPANNPSIIMTQDGETILFSLGKIKLWEIKPHNVTNYTMK
jgi:hypothetical protein